MLEQVNCQSLLRAVVYFLLRGGLLSWNRGTEAGTAGNKHDPNFRRFGRAVVQLKVNEKTFQLVLKILTVFSEAVWYHSFKNPDI